MKIFLGYLILPFMTVCIIAVGAIVFHRLSSSENVSLLQPKGDSAKAGKGEMAEEVSYDLRISKPNKDFIYPAGDARDPFQRAETEVNIKPSKPAVEQPMIVLVGIIWDEKNPIAIIKDSGGNTHLTKPGEEIGKVKVLTIRPGSITVKSSGKILELTL